MSFLPFGMSIQRVGLKELLLGAVLFAFCGGPVQAEPQVEVRLEPRAAVKVGQTSQFTIRVEWKSEEADYQFSQPELVLDGFTMESIGGSDEVFQEEGREWKRKMFRFTMKANQSGIGRIRPFQINYIDPLKRIGGHFDIQALELKIIPDRSQLYRKVKLGAASGGGLLLVLGGWLFLRRFRWREKKIPTQEPNLEGQYAASLAELEKAVKSWKPGRNEVFEVGKLFRSYLSEKYSIPGGLITSDEMMQKMGGRVSPEELKTLKRIFDKLDQWRYSDREQSIDEWKQLFHEMIHYIEGKKVIPA